MSAVVVGTARRRTSTAPQRDPLEFRKFSNYEDRLAPSLTLPATAPMSSSTSVRHLRWTDIPKESVTAQLSRRLVTGDRMMLAHVYLDKGCIVPKHSHENEQITWIVEGALKFWIGEDGAEEVIVRAGEVLHIPSNVPHMAEALEDTLDVDIFSPIRQDWLDHTDGYFHSNVKK
jgi:quercetin dioxygenase-like cupin family protein